MHCRVVSRHCDAGIGTMTIKAMTCLVLLALIFCCRPPDVVHRYVPVEPDLYVYNGGIFFQSKDGLKTFGRVALLPGRMKDQVLIVFPDNTTVDAIELSPESFRQRGMESHVKGDDGKGNFTLMSSSIGLHATVRSN